MTAYLLYSAACKADDINEVKYFYRYSSVTLLRHAFLVTRGFGALRTTPLIMEIGIKRFYNGLR